MKSAVIKNKSLISLGIQSKIPTKPKVIYPQVWDEYANSCIICSEIIDDLLQQTEKICYEHHLQNEFPKYNAKVCLWVESTLLDLHFFSHDINISDDEIFEDQEPISQQLDSRQVRRVPVRQKPENHPTFLTSKQEESEAELFAKSINLLSELLPQNKLYCNPQSARSYSPNDSRSRISINKNNNDIEFEKFKEKYIQEALLKSKLSFLVIPEQTYVDKLLQKDKERSYVRRIIQKQVVSETIKKLNSSYNNNDGIATDDQQSFEFPQQKIQKQINNKYFSYLGSPNKRSLSPSHKIQVPKIIDVPHATIEMDYRPEVRSISPIASSHVALLQLNQERVIQKQSNFSSKLQKIIQEQKQIDAKKFLINNQFFNKNAKLPNQFNSPKKCDVNDDQITTLLQYNKKQTDPLPELKMKRIRIYK